MLILNICKCIYCNGKLIKYTADIKIDDVVIKQAKISDKASFYLNKDRLFRGEQNKEKVLVGPMEKLK